MESAISKTDYNKICQICLKVKKGLKKIETEITKLFNIYNSLPITEDPDFPTQICPDCLQNATESYKFYQLCLTSNQFLQQLGPYEPLKVDQELQADTNQEELVGFDSSNDESEDLQPLKELQHQYDSDTARSAWNKAVSLGQEKCDPETKTCNICNKILYNLNALVRHVESHDESRQFVATCLTCGRGFYDKQHLENHILKHKVEPKYKCNHCDKVYLERNQFRSHVQQKHPNYKISCPECEKSFHLQPDLDTHMRTHNKEPFKCLDCGKTFKFRYRLKDHQWMHAKERIFDCKKCEKSFKSKQVLQLHYKRIHFGVQKRHECNICGKNVLYLKNHLNVHNNAKFQCSTCSQEFRNKYSLEKHIKRKHTNMDDASLNPFLCNICGRRSENLRMLKRHFLSHSDVRPHACQICGKNFKTEYRRDKHIKHTHDNIRDYKCNFCFKGFHTKTGLTIHLRVHTGERPYSCKMCGKAFQQRSTLRTHMKVHGLDTESSLDQITMQIEEIIQSRRKAWQMCGKAFQQRSTLRTHMKVHGLDTESSLDQITMQIEVNLKQKNK